VAGHRGAESRLIYAQWIKNAEILLPPKSEALHNLLIWFGPFWRFARLVVRLPSANRRAATSLTNPQINPQSAIRNPQ
jgi:hypothetical protein